MIRRKMKPHNLIPHLEFQFSMRITNRCTICRAEKHGTLQY